MIRSDKAYEESLKRVEENSKVIEAQRQELLRLGIPIEKQIAAMAPLINFTEDIKYEIIQYERIKRGDFSDFQKPEDIGRLLIAIRIAQGITQRELADRLGVSEAQVSRDERNEYHKASYERIQTVLKALRREIQLTVLESNDKNLDKEFVNR
jgi:DNA-binding XRE family transcriptional regulator